MISIIVAIVILLVGFIFYGRFVERIFSPDDRKTPAEALNDGVDYVPIGKQF